MVTKDNQWRPGTWLDAYPNFFKLNPNYQNKILAWEYKKEPTIGYHVVDFNLKQNGTIESYHFGSPVTKILTGEQISEEVFECHSLKIDFSPPLLLPPLFTPKLPLIDVDIACNELRRSLAFISLDHCWCSNRCPSFR